MKQAFKNTSRKKQRGERDRLRFQKKRKQLLTLLILLFAFFSLFFPTLIGGSVLTIYSHLISAGGTIASIYIVYGNDGAILSHIPHKWLETLDKVYAITMDWVFSVGTLPLFLIDLAWFEPREGANKEETPILLVHGYLHNSSAWIYLRHQLRKAGFKNVYTINLGLPLDSIHGFSEKVAKKAEQIKAWTGRDDLIIVGHSMGGIVSSYYAARMAKKGTVAKVITLASPFKGAKRADIGIGQCAKELKINSPFLQSLKKEILARSDIQFLNFGSIHDPTIQPINSAFVSGKAAKVYEGIGHVMFLYSNEVAQDLVATIRG